MTHTYAVLDVPFAVYAAVRALLVRANYEHTFTKGREGEEIDMHGIGLRALPSKGNDEIAVSTLVSARNQTGRIDFSLNGELTQWDLDKAREVVGMLQGAIEAAATDAMLFQFLTTKVNLSPEAAGAALLDFREMRQGSREKVYPS